MVRNSLTNLLDKLYFSKMSKMFFRVHWIALTVAVVPRVFSVFSGAGYSWLSNIRHRRLANKRAARCEYTWVAFGERSRLGSLTQTNAASGTLALCEWMFRSVCVYPWVAFRIWLRRASENPDRIQHCAFQVSGSLSGSKFIHKTPISKINISIINNN